MSRVEPVLEQAERKVLEAFYKEGANHTLRQRCQVVLLKAARRLEQEVAAVVGLCQANVDSWVKRYPNPANESMTVEQPENADVVII